MCKLTKYKDGGEIRIFIGTKAFALTPITGLESSVILSTSDYCGTGTTIWDIDNNRVLFQVREDIQQVEDLLINGW
jgi:hypothetical protein